MKGLSRGFEGVKAWETRKLATLVVPLFNKIAIVALKSMSKRELRTTCIKFNWEIVRDAVVVNVKVITALFGRDGSAIDHGCGRSVSQRPVFVPWQISCRPVWMENGSPQERSQPA
jgi:hypothetical protein